MKYVVYSLIFLFLSLGTSNAGNGHIETLLDICTIAQKTGDEGTIKNIANQIKTEQIPDDELYAKRYNACLTAAFGEADKSNNVSVLLKRISETKNQLIADCNKLLVEDPQVAITNSICKEIFLK